MTKAIALSLILAPSYLTNAQEIAGLSYCLLFDSKLEKNAFQENLRDCDPMIFLLAYDPNIDSSQYETVRTDIHEFVNKLASKKNKYRDESNFLNHVFHKVHSKYLRNYKNTETFSGIFNNGSYNCVSGTALYAFVLTQLGYHPTIFETRYHIFLKVTTADSVNCLFEATDPFSGFECKQDQVQSRVNRYIQNEKLIAKASETLSAPFNNKDIMHEVTLVELGGLHYYNIAVDFINKENFYDAFRALKKASLLYPSSERINDFLEFTQFKHDAELSEAFRDH